MKIIGITGTIGAGKGTIVEYLVGTKEYAHYSVRSFLIEEIKRRGLKVDRDSMTSVANDLRAKHSPSYIVEQLYKQALTKGKNCVIESLRAVGEVAALQKKGSFSLFAVDADSEIRYQRILLRKSETDNVSFETFLKNEEREFNSSDPNKQNLQQCILMADHVFHNNNTINDLCQEVEKVLNK